MLLSGILVLNQVLSGVRLCKGMSCLALKTSFLQGEYTLKLLSVQFANVYNPGFEVPASAIGVNATLLR